MYGGGAAEDRQRRMRRTFVVRGGAGRIQYMYAQS